MKYVTPLILLAFHSLCAAQYSPQISGINLSTSAPLFPYEIMDHGSTCKSDLPLCYETWAISSWIPTGQSSATLSIKSTHPIEGSIKILVTPSIINIPENEITPYSFSYQTSLKNNISGIEFTNKPGESTIYIPTSTDERWDYTATFEFNYQPGTYLHPGFSICEPHGLPPYTCQLFDSFIANTYAQTALAVTISAVPEASPFAQATAGYLSIWALFALRSKIAKLRHHIPNTTSLWRSSAKKSSA